MKTLRQILFERHRPAESKLEVIRQNALATLKAPSAVDRPVRSPETIAPARVFSWREFVLSLRWHVAGMAAVWFAVVFLNLERAPAPVFAVAGAPPAQQILASLQEHRRLLLEMIDLPAAEPAIAPRRRSASRSWTEIV